MQAPPDVIGEMAFMSGGTATATLITGSPTRFLSWWFQDLQTLPARSAEIHAALQNVFNENLMDKPMEQRDRSRAAMA